MGSEVARGALREMSPIRPLRPGEALVCEQIMRSLPDWFGIESSIVGYTQAIPRLESYGVEVGEELAGFLSLEATSPVTTEIHVMAVRPAERRQGIGRALVEHAETLLRARGVELLQVKTLGPSRPNPAYEQTRGFYARLGFLPLEENNLWGSVNPCLILVKHLRCPPPQPPG